MKAQFQDNTTYYSDRDTDITCRVNYRTARFVVTVPKNRFRIQLDSNGNEYFESTDPYHGTFRYSACNKR